MLILSSIPPILLAALIIDAVVGDPPALYARIAHPVVLIGRLIAWLERWLYGPASGRRLRGVALTMVTVTLAAGAGGVVALIARAIEYPWGLALEAIAASTLLAGRSLHDHVRDVAQGLRQGLALGRTAVARIVGRDPQSLDEAGVARAAIESAAENFSDGLVAPAFWFLLLGLPGIAAYKAVNTLDSMIGHKDERYRDFGWAAARLDDLANLLPARLAALLLIIASGAKAADAGRAAWRDARLHHSPNAGWPEAAMAGALGLKLGGPRRYDGEAIDEPWLGSGRTEADAGDIDRCLNLYRLAWLLLALLVAGAIGAGNLL